MEEKRFQQNSQTISIFCFLEPRFSQDDAKWARWYLHKHQSVPQESNSQLREIASFVMDGQYDWPLFQKETLSVYQGR